MSAPPVKDMVTSNGVSQPGDAANLQELSTLIQTVLQQTQDRFQTMSDQIVKRIDEMSGRIDSLETNINDLMVQAGVQPEGTAPTPTPQQANQQGSDSLDNSHN